MIDDNTTMGLTILPSACRYIVPEGWFSSGIKHLIAIYIDKSGSLDYLTKAIVEAETLRSLTSA